MKIPAQIVDNVYGIVYETSDELAAALDKLDHRVREQMCRLIERSVAITLDRAGLVAIVPVSQVEAK